MPLFTPYEAGAPLLYSKVTYLLFGICGATVQALAYFSAYVNQCMQVTVMVAVATLGEAGACCLNYAPF